MKDLLCIVVKYGYYKYLFCYSYLCCYVASVRHLVIIIYDDLFRLSEHEHSPAPAPADGQLRSDGPDRCPQVGSTEHQGIRRRPRDGHSIWTQVRRGYDRWNQHFEDSILFLGQQDF